MVFIHKKAEISNQTLGILLVVAITLSLIGTFISITKVGQTPTIRLIGYAIEQNTSQAIINLTVDQVLDINFTVSGIDFGEGSVDPGEINCTLSTQGTGNSASCTGFVNNVGNSLFMQNIGNVNISVNISFDKNASIFIGGTSPSFYFAWYCKTGEELGCRNTTGSQACPTDGSGWPDVNLINSLGGSVNTTALTEINDTTTNDYVTCPNLDYAEATDELRLEYDIIIPSDSFTGNLSTTVTTTAYIIDCQLAGTC